MFPPWGKCTNWGTSVPRLKTRLVGHCGVFWNCLRVLLQLKMTDDCHPELVFWRTQSQAAGAEMIRYSNQKTGLITARVIR